MKQTTVKKTARGNYNHWLPNRREGEKSPTTGWRKTLNDGERKLDHFAHISNMVGIKQNELKME